MLLSTASLVSSSSSFLENLELKDVVLYLGGEAEGEGLAGGLVVSVQVTEGGGQLVMMGHTRRH